MKFKRKISLRMRVTVISGFALTVICLILSFVILQNAQYYIIGPTTLLPQDYQGGHLGMTPGAAEEEALLVPDDGISVGGYAQNITQFYKYTIIGIIAALVSGIILIYIVTGIALKPLSQLNKEITGTDPDDLSKRIMGFSAGDELDSLAKSFNEMLGRIEQAFYRERSFSAGAAHELKTPLAVIKANLDVLALSSKPTDEEYAETLRVVKNQTDRMTTLVSDLFAMCALNGYEIVDTVDINQLLLEIIEEQQPFATEKHISPTVQSVPCRVTANAVMLRHALSNIIANAIKYNTDHGSVHIELAVEDNRAKISVSDTGIGISKAAVPHIFEPFFREDKSRSRKIGGAGLGLSISKSIIEQHGGEIMYQPGNTQGSTFIVYLPIK